MQIETKFNVDEEVFIMFQNKVQKSKIYWIDIRVYSEGISIKYDIRTVPEGYCDGQIPENRIFATKQELLNSL